MRHSAMRRTRTGLDCPFRPISACTRVDSPFHPHTHDLALSSSSHYCAAVSFLFQSQDSRLTHLRASAVQMVRGLSSALLPAAALPLSRLNWFVMVYIYRRRRNPLNSPLYSSMIISTPVTLAYSGPFLHHSTILSTSSFSPSKMASTRPSDRFRTQPERPSSSALSFVLDLKNTPCTFPETRT